MGDLDDPERGSFGLWIDAAIVGAPAREPGSELDAPALWAAASAGSRRDPTRIAPDTYRALFAHAFERAYPSQLVSEVPCSSRAVVPHVIQVRRPKTDPGFVIITNGLGRVEQPHGEAAGAAHVELAAWVDEADFELVQWVGRIGPLLHGRGAGASAFKPGDTLRAPIPELGIAGFVLADGGFVPMPAGAPITLLALIPLDAADYAAASGAGTAWLAESYRSAEDRAKARARWQGR